MRLGEIGDWGSGETPSRTNADFYGGDIPLLKTGDLTDGYIYDVPECITKFALEKTSVRLNPKGSILIAMYGATIGKLAILTKAMTTNQACCACIVFPSVYNLYLFYFLLANRNGFIKQGEGGAQPNISKDKIINSLIPLPPLAEQKRIVEKIEELLPLVDRYEKAWKRLEELNKKIPLDMQKSILQEAIQGKLVNQRKEEGSGEELFEEIQKEKQKLIEEGKLKKSLPEITKDETPFDIPETWKWVRLGEISTYSQTKRKVKASDIISPIWSLDLEDIEKESGKIIRHIMSNERKISGEKIVFENGQILHSKLRPYLKKILIAPDRGICTSELVPFDIIGNCDNRFIVFVLKSSYIDFLINSVSYGVKIPRVGTETMTNLLIPLPPLAEQKRIVEKIEELLPLCEKLK